jgi:glutathione S-transferase kappa 1
MSHSTQASRIQFYYDVVSPFSYLALEVLRRYRLLWRFELDLQPLFLGGIMQGSGNRPPASIPLKGLYLPADLDRYKKMTNIPFKHPSNFPLLTLLPMRVLRVVKRKRPLILEEVTLKLMRAYHVYDQDISQPTVVKECLASFYAPEELERLVTIEANSPQNKDDLIKNVEEALAKGVFGVPTMFVTRPEGGEAMMFFGADRIEHIAWFLGVEYKGLGYGTPESKANL